MTAIPIYLTGPSVSDELASTPFIVIEVPPRPVTPREAPRTLWYEEAMAEWQAEHDGRKPAEVREEDVTIRPRWRDLEARLQARRRPKLGLLALMLSLLW